MKEYKFTAVAFTAGAFVHEIPGARFGETVVAPFALDMDTIQFAKNPCVVDYDHDSDQPVGRAVLKVSGGKLLAEGALVSAQPGDRAEQIALSSNGIPYGISPTLDLWAAERVEIGERETIDANGRTYEGPLVLFRGAVVLGLSVCPYPTDSGTSITTLNKGEYFMTKLNIDAADAEKIEGGPVDQEVPVNVDEAIKDIQARLTLLEDYAGDEVDKKDDVADALNSILARLAKLESDASADADDNKADDGLEELAGDCSDDEQKTGGTSVEQLSRKLDGISKGLSRLSREVASLRLSNRRGDVDGASFGGAFDGRREISYQDAFRRSINNRR